jgi:hypothetical protein
VAVAIGTDELDSGAELGVRRIGRRLHMLGGLSKSADSPVDDPKFSFVLRGGSNSLGELKQRRPPQLQATVAHASPRSAGPGDWAKLKDSLADHLLAFGEVCGLQMAAVSPLPICGSHCPATLSTRRLRGSRRPRSPVILAQYDSGSDYSSAKKEL